MGHRNFKRISHRMKEEVYSTVEISKVIGFKKAWSSFIGKIDIQMMVRNGHIEKPKYTKHLMKKHESMNDYFEKACPMSIQCQNVTVPPQNEEYKDCIWICWWQGLEHAPDIVKSCVHSIQKHAGDHKVIIITDDNYKNFVQFPSWIEEKYKRGIITKTHISDILRLKLLGTYGGMWLDSTFFCVGSLSPYFERSVWSIKRPDYRHTSVACGYFANYSFGCDTEHRRVFAILAEYVMQYWKNYDYMVDYLFLDYLIVQAQKQDLYIQEAFESIAPNNPNCDELLNVLGNEFNENVWNDLKKNTDLFKLTWKANFPEQIHDKDTFYGRLISDKL